MSRHEPQAPSVDPIGDGQTATATALRAADKVQWSSDSEKSETCGYT